MNSAQKLAAFLLEDEGSWDFTTKIDPRNISTTGEQDNWYLQSAEAVVEWSLDLDVRSWGLKEANPVLKSVRLRLEYEVDNELEGGQNTFETVELNYPSATARAAPVPTEDDDLKRSLMHYANHVQAEVSWNPRDERSTMIVPTDIEADIRTSKITVFF